MTTNAMAGTVEAIEAELARLGWLRTHDTPCDYAVTADDDLPRGWVRVYCDHADGYGDGVEVLSDLRTVPVDAEYGTGCPTDGKPTTVREWPDDLVRTEELEDGGPNDNPNTLVTVETNAGTRYAAGPHGVSCDALADWFGSGMELAETRDDAIDAGCEATDD